MWHSNCLNKHMHLQAWRFRRKKTQSPQVSQLQYMSYLKNDYAYVPSSQISEKTIENTCHKLKTYLLYE